MVMLMTFSQPLTDEVLCYREPGSVGEAQP